LSGLQIGRPWASVASKSRRTWASKLKKPLFSVSRVIKWWPWSTPGSVTKSTVITSLRLVPL